MVAMEQELQEVAVSLNKAFDDLKKVADIGPRSTKDPIFFTMRMISFLGKLIEQHGSRDGGLCHGCGGVSTPCPTIKSLLDHASGRAFQD